MSTSNPPSQQSPSERMQQQRAWALVTQVLTLAFVLVIVLLPLLPSPVAGVEWRSHGWELVAFALEPALPDPDWGLAVAPAPVFIWLERALGLGGIILVLALVGHLIALYRQRTSPLDVARTYVRLRTPLTLDLKPADGLTLLRTLHGQLPSKSPLTGAGAPLVLRWTGRPERAIAQGVCVLGSPTLLTSVQRTLAGLGNGTEATVADDPLLAACAPDRLLCWAEVRLAAPDDLPIAVPAGGETPLVDGLLPALAPQRDIYASDVQIILRPIPDRRWLLPVQARLETSKSDSLSSERRALEQKAAGPAFAVCIRLLAVAQTPQAGAAMVQTLGAAFAASAQSVGATQQRLVVGPVRSLPAVLPPPPPLPRGAASAAGTLGFLLAGVALLLVGATEGAPQLLALPPLLALLPWSIVGTCWRRRVRADRWLMLQTLLRSVPPPRNPRIIPIWSDWFGRR